MLRFEITDPGINLTDPMGNDLGMHPIAVVEAEDQAAAIQFYLEGLSVIYDPEEVVARIQVEEVPEP